MSSLAPIKRLDSGPRYEGKESAVDTRRFLRGAFFWALGYETAQSVIRTQTHIRLSMCGRHAPNSNADVCVMDRVNSKLSLLAREDKIYINPADSEPQLVAEAMAAY